MRRITVKSYPFPGYPTAAAVIAAGTRISRESSIEADAALLAGARLLTTSWSDATATLFFQGGLILEISLLQPTKLSWRILSGSPASAPANGHPWTESIEIDWGVSASGEYLGVRVYDPLSLLEKRVGLPLTKLFYNGIDVAVYFEGVPFLAFSGHLSCVETGRPLIYLYEEQVWWK